MLRKAKLPLKVVPGILMALCIIVAMALVTMNKEQADWPIPVGTGTGGSSG